MERMTKVQLSDTITSLFYENVEKQNLSSFVRLQLVRSPLASIGSLSIGKDLASATMKINLNKVSAHCSSSREVSWQAYQTIAHEMEHAKTCFFTQRDDFYSYEHLISLMEYLYYASRLNIDFDHISLGFFSAYTFRKQLGKNYDLSAAELIANLESYKQVKEKFGHEFSEEKEETCDQILASLEYLNSYMEVYYDEVGEPYNRFLLFVTHVGSYLAKYPKVMEQFPILGHFFHSDGTPKRLYEVYRNRNQENDGMYRKWMMAYLSGIKEDSSSSFADPAFRSYVEDLISDYMQSTIDCYQKKKLGTLFINKPKVLSDNLIVRKKNIQILSGIAQQYGLQVSSGTVLDSNHVYMKKSLLPNA